MPTSFSGGKSRSTRRETLTMGTGKRYHLRLRVECTLFVIYKVYPFCNLQSRVWTHVVFVIGLYELLGNPTT
jgi:hypothetical protein